MQERKIDLSKINYRINEDDNDIVQHFLEVNKHVPSYARINGPFIYDEVLSLLKDGKQDWSWEESDTEKSSYFRMKHNDSTMFVILKRSYILEEDKYQIEKSKIKYKKKKGFIVTYEVCVLYSFYAGRPDKFIEKIEKMRLDENQDHNHIHLICQDSDNVLYTKEYPLLKTSFDYDLDLHYGEGFSKFHDVNLTRIDASEKGIILLHGSPGTGKSYYIRRLIRDLSRGTKKILYLPNNMVDLLGTPSFNNFLLEFIHDSIESGNNKGVLIVIEDAERVLLKRETNPYGSDGVSNILNSTDGILNDFLNIQILATFNTDIRNIDEAILRKRRAISIREFKNLSIEESQKLIDFLGIDFKAEESMCLADIYSIKQEEEDKVLLQDSKKNTNIGFGGKKS